MIDKVPNWLRWTLFLPLAFLALLIGNVLYPILRLTYEFLAPAAYEWAADGAAILMGSAINGFLLVWAGTRVAPAFKLHVGIVLAGLFGLWSAFLIYAKYVGIGDSLVANSRFEVIVNLVAGVGGAIVAIQIAARNGANDVERNL